MGREVRMVPANWEHPRTMDGHFQPKFAGSYTEAFEDWLRCKREWESGIFPEYADEDDRKLPYEEWGGSAPQYEYFMPEFKPGEATHYMMYETTSEGTPISPAFATPEELAHWLADTGASAFADITATYGQWLSMIKGPGYAPSAVIEGGLLKSGVEASAPEEKD